MILVAIEHDRGVPRKACLETITLGRELAEATGQDLAAVVAGSDDQVERVARGVAAFGLRVVCICSPDLAVPRVEPLTRALQQAVKHLGADVVLAPASKFALAYTPRLALRLGAVLLEEVIGLRVDSGRFVATRLSYLSRVTETVAAEGTPVVVSVASGTMASPSDARAGGTIENIAARIHDRDKRVRVVDRRTSSSKRVALEDADVVVTGGRGFGGPDAFEQHVVGLADALGAAVGATRAVVDAGWRPYGEQVGQTGHTVAPRLYVALAVSGAVQHLSGMNRSSVIVAVNKDPEAPIFKVADYGIVGDVLDVVPALVQAIASSD